MVCGSKAAQDAIMDLTDPYDIMAEGKKIRDTREWAKHICCLQGHSTCMRPHSILCGGCCLHLGQGDQCTYDNIPGENIHGNLLERIRKQLKEDDERDDEGEDEGEDGENDKNEEETPKEG